MTYRRNLFIAGVICTLMCPEPVTANDSEVVSIIQRAQTSPLASQALKIEEDLRKAQGLAYAQLLKLGSSQRAESLELGPIERGLEKDIQILETMDDAIKPLQVGDSEITWSLKTNKMKIILKGAQDLLKQYYESLQRGELPPGYNIRQNSPTVLGWNETCVYGSSKGTFLTAALLRMAREQNSNSWPLDVDRPPLKN